MGLISTQRSVDPPVSWPLPPLPPPPTPQAAMDRKSFAYGLAAGAVAAGALAAAVPLVVRALGRAGPPSLDGSSREERCIAHVFAKAKRGDPASVLAAIDEFCWGQGFMMNVGDVKGKIVTRAVKDAAPRVVLEFGGYCG
jgi:hypothetical protein